MGDFVAGKVGSLHLKDERVLCLALRLNQRGGHSGPWLEDAHAFISNFAQKWHTFMLVAPNHKVEEVGQAFVGDREAWVEAVHTFIAILVEHKDTENGAVYLTVFVRRSVEINQIFLY